MRKDLHYLKALKTFEVAARLLSFTRAADALFVTQAAVSHQIRQLENHLGQKLFERLVRKVQLTPAGETLLHTLSQAFQSIEQVMDQLQQQARQQHGLTIALTPLFSSRWLVSRLPAFWAAHPEIELKLHHTVQHVDLKREGADLAIRWGQREDWPELVADPLFGTLLTPVCAPSYRMDGRQLCQPADLAWATLLHEDNHQDWQRWLQHAGCGQLAVRHGPTIDDSNALLMAAIAGQGVALGRLAFIQQELDTGLLRRPFSHTITSQGRYWLVYPPSLAERPALQAFRRFLLDESARMPVPEG